jgi:tetratricopeptide (TPR) repeat protein
MKLTWLVAIGVLVLAGAPVAVTAQSGAVGAVAFANSGKPAAQQAFHRGLALLHSFEYDRAAAAFREAQAADPDFAMAYWGEAMTHNHPVWMAQDLPAARAVLARLGPTTQARAAKARTQRERDYLAAVETLYGEGTKFERDFRYAEAMGGVHGSYPADVDAVAFHALALLGTAHAGRDFAVYMKAGAMLEEVFPANPDHPGVLHYLIHSYDDPIHAPLGLRAAQRYGAVAPDAGHALHMTSHIFVAMGMWDEVIATNERAVEVVNDQRAAAGRGPSWCGHYPSWLVYGLLQEGLGARALDVTAKCGVRASGDESPASAASADPDSSRINSWLFMRAMVAADSGRLLPLDGIDLSRRSDWERLSEAYGRLLAARAASDGSALAAAAYEIAAIAPSLQAALDKAAGPEPAARAMIEAMRLQGEGLVKLGRGDIPAALAALEAAAKAEEAAPIEFGPPAVAKPSRELLGDVLLGLGRKPDAASAYRAALARAPGRRLAVDGLRVAERR